MSLMIVPESEEAFALLKTSAVPENELELKVMADLGKLLYSEIGKRMTIHRFDELLIKHMGVQFSRGHGGMTKNVS